MWAKLGACSNYALATRNGWSPLRWKHSGSMSEIEICQFRRLRLGHAVTLLLNLKLVNVPDRHYQQNKGHSNYYQEQEHSCANCFAVSGHCYPQFVLQKPTK